MSTFFLVATGNVLRRTQPVARNLQMAKQGSLVELPVPSFYTRDYIDHPNTWFPRWPEIFEEANRFVKEHKIRPSATDQFRIALLPVDMQLTFCHPRYELYVGGRSGTGALDDADRASRWIGRNVHLITEAFPTLDTHFPWTLFHPSMLVNANGDHPDPRIPFPVTEADLDSGKWRVCPRGVAALAGSASLGMIEHHLRHYVRSLEKAGKHTHMVWTFHGLLGTPSHSLVPSFAEMLFYHSIVRGVNNPGQIKGGDTLTENYSIFGPEVKEYADKRPLGRKNTVLLKLLQSYDAVVIFGQAKSHCVAWTIENLLEELKNDKPELIERVYLLTDCTSPVVVPGTPIDFTDYADQKFREFESAGAKLVTTDVPLSDWPGVDKKRLAV